MKRIELTAGVELRLDRLVPGLATAVEGRLVTANLVGEQNQLAPFFGLSLHYGSTPVRVRTPRGVDDDLYLLAILIRAEAEGEPYEGQVAVGAVVMNRVKSRQFPNTIYRCDLPTAAVQLPAETGDHGPERPMPAGGSGCHGRQRSFAGGIILLQPEACLARRSQVLSDGKPDAHGDHREPPFL